MIFIEMTIFALGWISLLTKHVELEARSTLMNRILAYAQRTSCRLGCGQGGRMRHPATAPTLQFAIGLLVWFQHLQGTALHSCLQKRKILSRCRTITLS